VLIEELEHVFAIFGRELAVAHRAGPLGAARRISRLAAGTVVLRVDGAIETRRVVTGSSAEAVSESPGHGFAADLGGVAAVVQAVERLLEASLSSLGFFEAPREFFLELFAIDRRLVGLWVVFRRRLILRAGLNRLVWSAIAVLATLLAALGLGQCGAGEEQRDGRGEEFSV